MLGKTMFLLACPRCAAKNRFASGTRVRCGKCKYEFTPRDLVHAKADVPAVVLHMQEDIVPGTGPWYACKDEDECGWSGQESHLEEDKRCPECGGKTRRLKETQIDTDAAAKTIGNIFKDRK